MEVISLSREQVAMYIFSVHSNYARLWISGWLWMEELNSNAWLTQNQETLRSDRAPLQEFNHENRSGTTKVSYNLDSHWILLRGWKVDVTPHKSPLLHVFYYYEIPVLCVSVQFSSVTQSCLTLCNPMDCSTPGSPVHHQLLEPAQTHVHWVDDAIQSSHPLLSPSPPTFNLLQHQSLFQWVSSSHQVARVLEFQLQHQSFQWIFRTDFL